MRRNFRPRGAILEPGIINYPSQIIQEHFHRPKWTCITSAPPCLSLHSPFRIFLLLCPCSRGSNQVYYVVESSAFTRLCTFTEHRCRKSRKESHHVHNPWVCISRASIASDLTCDHRSFIAGGIAACGAVTVTHGFETVKIRCA
jgi:hypothetical protein